MQSLSFIPRNRAPRPGKIGFLDLPGEIRNQIYLMVIPDGKKIRPVVRGDTKRMPIPKAHNHQRFAIPNHWLFPFAQTCKQILQEILPLFYDRNTLWFDSIYDLYICLYRAGALRRPSIRSIRVFLVYRDAFSRNIRIRPKEVIPMQRILKLAFDLMGDCTSLQKLYLGIQTDTLNTIDKKLCRLADLRKTGVFDGVRNLPNLDLRVREIWYWEKDWGLTIPYSSNWGSRDKFPTPDQFESGLNEQPIWVRKKFPVKQSKEAMISFENALKLDMAGPKVEVKTEAFYSPVGRKSGPLGGGSLRSARHSQPVEGSVRRASASQSESSGSALAEASSSRTPGWRF